MCCHLKVLSQLFFKHFFYNVKYNVNYNVKLCNTIMEILRELGFLVLYFSSLPVPVAAVLSSIGGR